MINYKMIIYTIETDVGTHYVAEYPALDGVVGSGATDMEAILDLKNNATAHLEALEALGMDIPKVDMGEEDISSFSGKISYRPGKYNHHKLHHAAQSYGVSVNSLINDAVNFYLGTQVNDKQDIIREINSLKEIVQHNHREIRESTLLKSSTKNSWISSGSYLGPQYIN